jgi:hypothetical protein
MLWDIDSKSHDGSWLELGFIDIEVQTRYLGTSPKFNTRQTLQHDRS